MAGFAAFRCCTPDADANRTRATNALNRVGSADAVPLLRYCGGYTVRVGGSSTGPDHSEELSPGDFCAHAFIGGAPATIFRGICSCIVVVGLSIGSLDIPGRRD